MKKYLVILFAALLLFSCSKSEQGASVSAPVLFSLDTKSLGVGERTFRVALFNVTTNAFLAQGTYCNEIIDHSATVTGGEWLSPCRVDNAGLPLKSDGTEAEGLSQADKNSKYGLRYQIGDSYYFVAASPGKAFVNVGSLRYYPWTADHATDLYVSEPVIIPLSGSWLGGEYVYKPSTREALTLKNRSSRIYVHIECDALSTAYIQSVRLLNCVTEARWYMTTGFSTSNYTADSYSLFNYIIDNAGVVLTLTKADPEHPEIPAVTWTSDDEVFLPSIDYSDNTYSAMRPMIQVLMGENTDHPATALIDITENVEPMKNYTYNLKVSKSQVSIYLSVASWDDGGTISSVDNEEPCLIGTVTVDGWSNGGTNTAEPWNDPS